MTIDLPDLPGALCTQVDPALWFPDVRDYQTVALARAICADCPEAVPCLEYAVKDPSLVGVWAGTTPTQRRDLRRKAR